MSEKKFFYVGMQRTGTKSFGEFARANNLRVCSWSDIQERDLSRKWFEMEWSEIVNSGLLEEYDVFEDGPFMDPSFVKFLFNHVNQGYVVHFTRPASDWYKSMVTHSNGLNPGDVRRHAYMYDRLEDLYFLEANEVHDTSKLPIIGMKEHYERLHRLHHFRVLEKFRSLGKERFFSTSLYDEDKFQKMCRQFGVNFEKQYEQKSHVTKTTFKDVVNEKDYLKTTKVWGGYVDRILRKIKNRRR